ncbi:glycosyltransferase family 2 protein [Mucilaginibacter roseus]|uniref:Glycosyltransferase family 2 protein n=1 Tax=Mucilaginibacter roseus TaxID=1528868 RepID=A0ABS8U8M0_9SPHI|nr:glycosyltransferase family 2 protein [Mucilaginibacter roseus]MCD8742548.1 glycosyltransferase family 2 protein [Mucilaginibacter roseus]
MIIAISVTLFFIVLRFVVTLFNFMSNPKLQRIAKPYNDMVSILIPARNEEQNIDNLLRSITRQEYQNYEVIILDDNSTDNTFAICQHYAAAHPNFKVIKGEALPDGWLGKNFACYQLAKQAKGKYLMFVDADEEIEHGLINSAVHRMHLRQVALLSLFTNQRMVTLGEKLVVPLMHFLLLNLLPIRLIYLTRHYAVAAASGQFMFFDAEAYHANQWHKQVRDKVVEDVEIMKLVKAARYRGEGLLANDLIYCRMYTGYNEAIQGFSKNFLAIFNYSVPGFLVYITLLIGGPMLVITTMNLPLIALMVGLIILTRIMISFSAGQNPLLNVVLHPLQMASMVVIAYFAVQQYLTKNTVWKGRRV